MARVRAVLLAAGRGIRMGGREPKALLPVGRHEPLVFYALNGLRAAGISDLLVVTGFRPDLVEEHVRKIWGDENLTFVFNARYASWGNFHSLRVAIDQSPGFDLLVVNSDIVVHPEVFSRVVETEGALVLAVQPRPRLSDEDMRVRLAGDRVLAIGKDLPRAHGHGEFAGVSMVRRVAARLYSEASTDLEWRRTTDLYYEDVYAALLDRTVARAAFVGEGEYAEIDVPDDVDHAAAVIDRHREAWEVRT